MPDTKTFPHPDEPEMPLSAAEPTGDTDERDDGDEPPPVRRPCAGRRPLFGQ
jgi:hypothetical protein